MDKIVLEQQLKNLDKTIQQHYGDEKNPGVLAGLSGLSLFQFYYAKYLDIDNNAEIGTKILMQSINTINNGYNYPTYCTGIAGMGWVIDHLEQEGFIDVDSDAVLSEMDPYLYTRMVLDIENGKYDFLHAAMGCAFYFLKRYENTKSKKLKSTYKKYLLEFLDALYRTSEKEGENKLKWLSVIDHETKEMGYNLSLSHGMASIIGVLTKLHGYIDFKELASKLLKSAVNYVADYKNEDNNAFSLFPSWIPKNNNIDYTSRVAWCYGDLGIGLQLWYASKTLKDEDLKQTSISILKHAAMRTKPEDTLITDAGICHGSYGNAQIFNRMYKETGDTVFKEATEFWIQDGLSKAIHKDGYCGYKQWNGKDKTWTSEISLLEGIAGIGLVILDYLADYNTNWDECLMIS